MSQGCLKWDQNLIWTLALSVTSFPILGFVLTFRFPVSRSPFPALRFSNIPWPKSRLAPACFEGASFTFIFRIFLKNFFIPKELRTKLRKFQIQYVYKQWKWLLPYEGTAREVWSDSSHIKTFSRMRLVASECCSVQPCSAFSPPHPCCLSGSAGERRIGPLGRGCLSVRVTLFFSYDKQRADFLGR